MSRAEGTVNLEVKGALQGALEVKTLEKALANLDKRAQKLSASQSKSVKTITDEFTLFGRKTRKVFDSFDKGIQMLGAGMTKFLGFALKSTIIQFAAFSAGLVGIHALFVAGKYLHKAYAWGMTAMAGAAASAAVAIGTAAAAIREQQAAMYAYTKGGAGEFVSGTNQARNAMRTLQSDAQLAGIGVQGLNKAYAAMAKSMKSSQIAQSGAMLKKLMDFGAAGQDPAAAADKVGALIEALNNSKTSMAKVKEAAKALGPQMEQALKKAKVTSKKQMKELIMSGELAKAGGVAGQFEAVNSTLIGQAKSFFNQIKGEFADFGQQFLGPAKESMQKIFKIIRRDLLRTSDSLSDFGTGKYMDGLVSIFEKVSGFFVKLIREWLPKTDGFFSKMSDWWGRVTRWFRISAEKLKPFVDGARAVEGLFTPILQALKSGFLDSFKSFSSNAVKSKENFKEIGNTLGGLITELFKLQQVFSDAFREALPFLSDVVKGITQVVQMMTGMLSKFSGLAGGPMAYMGMMILFRQMKAHKGGVLGVEKAPTNTMNVHAKYVYVGGKPVGGTATTPPTPPQGPKPIGPGRGPLAIGQGMKAIGPGSGGGGNLPVPYTQGRVLYDNQGRPLYGGRRHIFDWRRPPSDYPNPDAKLVGRRNSYIDPRSGKWVNNPGSFRRLIPGAGLAGTTGRVYEQVGYGPNGRSTYMGPGQTPIAAIGSGQALNDASGATQRRVLKMQQRYQLLAPGPEKDQAAAWLNANGHPLVPPGGDRFSTGAGGGTPPPAGGGGMPGPGGPGTAPPGAGGAGPAYYSRPGFFSKASRMAREQAVGQYGLGGNLFRSKITGRQWGGVDDRTGKVYRVTRKWDPVTGTYGVKEVGQYDEQTGHFRTRGMKLGTKLRYSGMTSRAIRDSALGSAILGNEKKGITGINNSMGAKLAVGMGMSMLSQHMAPEAQGAMALGGMVGQFNPLAGLAVGLGGTALKSRTAAGGALTGAGAGAAIGTMIAPGIGTAVGAALGAITGAIAGFAGGMRQRAKEAKAAMGSFLDGISIASFRSVQGEIVSQERTAAMGGDLSGSTGAVGKIAGKNAAKYGKLQRMLKEGGFTGKYAGSAKSQAGKGALRGAVGGLTAGAGYGALVGSAIPLPGVGTAAGALIGGTIGLIGGGVIGGAIGGVKGLFQRGKRNKDLKNDYALFKKILDDPDFRNIFSKEEIKKLEKDKAAGLSKLGKEIPERAKAAELINKQQTNRMDILTRMTGKSGAELEVLAKKMGVNLYDSTLKMQDVVDQLGISATKTAAELKNMNIDSALKGISDGFDEAIKRANAPKIYDERGRAVYDVVKGGGDTASVLEALKVFQESAMSMSSDPIQAFYEQQRQIGTLEKPGKLFQKNGAWAKMDPSKFFTPEVTKALQMQAASTEKGFATTASDQLTAQLAGLGMMANSAQMTAIIQNMKGPQKERFLKDMQAGNINIKDPFSELTDKQSKDLYTKAGFKSKEEYMANQVNTIFGSYGVQNSTVGLSNINKDTNIVADKMTDASKTFEAAVNAFNSNMASYFTDSAGKPEWWSKEAMKEIMGSDTSTPRGGIVGDTTSSRLSQTMARHNAINGSIPGRRIITSGYRTVALGSLNSDHVTGRALDIVGQNLGSYAVATRNAGGFAEFHGSGDSRHLHAVPGPGAIGDTLVPRSNQMGIAPGATVTSGGNSFTFHINGGQNNPEEIANIVMAKIKTAEQRIKERI